MMFGNAAALAGVRVPVPGQPAPGLEPASYVYTGGSAGGVLAASVQAARKSVSGCSPCCSRGIARFRHWAFASPRPAPARRDAMDPPEMAADDVIGLVNRSRPHLYHISAPSTTVPGSFTPTFPVAEMPISREPPRHLPRCRPGAASATLSPRSPVEACWLARP